MLAAGPLGHLLCLGTPTNLCLGIDEAKEVLRTANQSCSDNTYLLHDDLLLRLRLPSNHLSWVDFDTSQTGNASGIIFMTGMLRVYLSEGVS